MDRHETSVPVHLGELKQLSLVTAKAAFWWSCSTLAGGSALALHLAGLQNSNPTADQIALTKYDPAFCLVVAVIFVIAAVLESRQRNTLLHKIQEECGIKELTLPQKLFAWFRSWRMSDVQAKDSSLLLPPVRRVSLENAPALPRDET
ncbi:MAG: hypothetical protein ACYDC3_02320 [Candidatus Binataceae bacterium]